MSSPIAEGLQGILPSPQPAGLIKKRQDDNEKSAKPY